MTTQAFVDESKYRGFLLAAAIVAPADLAALRRTVGGLLLGGQRRIHFTSESDARRRVILSTLAAAGASALVYRVTGQRDVRRARDVALARLVDDLAKLGARLLVIERDDQALASDRRIIRERAQRAGCLGSLRYEHRRAHEEPLLAIADAVAWSWAKRGEWRRRAGPLVARELVL